MSGAELITTNLAARWPHIAAELYNAPLLITPDKAAIIEAALRDHATGQVVSIDAAAFRDDGKARSYRITTGGIAVISIMGSLARRGGYLLSLIHI